MSLATLLVILVVLPIAVAIGTVPALRSAAGRVMRQRSFVGAAILLAIAAIGLNGITEAMRLHFKKQPVPLAVPSLDDKQQGIPAKLGNWVQVSVDAPLDHTTQEVLGTKDFVFRDYVDSRVIGQTKLDEMVAMPVPQRLAELSKLPPEAVVRLAITYYTGLVDTVPHVPEKCYVADGFEPTQTPETRTQTLGQYADGSPRTVSYRHVNFQDTTEQAARADRDVCYLFHVNGRYESSNVGVRRELQNLFQPYGYFAKIELMTTARTHSTSDTEDRSASQSKSLKSIDDLFTQLLPHVERCLPDWKKVTSKK
jgi:hypothetical protein